MKYSSQIQRKVYMEIKTADGRDLSREEFRVIPGFTKYEITRDGDIRNIRSGRLLKEMENKRTGAFSYCLWTDEGKTTHRNWEGLMYLAYPELRPADKPAKLPTRRYARRGGWTDIPDFPKFQVHPDGIIRYKASRRRVEVHNDGYVDYVLLRNEEGTHRQIINGIRLRVFGLHQEKEAA